MDTFELIGSTMGLGFIAGLRLYATVLALGLGIRFGWIHPAGMAEPLGVLAHTAVLSVAAVAFAIEFCADKIPWVDSLWDGFHTFIRPIGAALAAAATLGTVDPLLRVVLILLCGGVAFASHSSKAATRLVVNHSPEPVSNAILSGAEDVFVPVAVWLSLSHPKFVFGLTAAFLVAFLCLAPRIFRSLRLQVVALKVWCMGKKEVDLSAASSPFSGQLPPAPTRILAGIAAQATPLPAPYGESTGIQAAATKQIKGLRHSIGYLAIEESGLTFLTRRAFRNRTHHIAYEDIRHAEWKTGLMINRLLIRTAAQDHEFYIFKNIDTKLSAGTVENARVAESSFDAETRRRRG